jgi:hypothetical protein
MNVSQFSADGALVSWDPSDCGADAVREAFSAAGFEKFAPKGRTEYEALKEAVGILKAKDQRVERHKSHEKNGCEILQVSRDASVNEYARRMGARVHVNDWDRKTVKLDSEITQYDQGRVDERFEQALCEVPSRELSNSLVAVVQSLDGERQREKGALWFIPSAHLDEWYALADGLSRAGNVNLMAFQVKLDERAARHIGESLTARMTKEAERLNEEIAGLKTPEAIDNRKLEIVSLMGRVERYKALLGMNLEAAEKALNLAQTAAMIAAMSAMQGVTC